MFKKLFKRKIHKEGVARDASGRCVGNMEIMQIEKSIIIKVWNCGLKEHAHKTKIAAEKCYKRKKVSNSNRMNTYKRNLIMVIDILENELNESIAKKYGLAMSSCERVRLRVIFNACRAYKIDRKDVDVLLDVIKRTLHYFEQGVAKRRFLTENGWYEARKWNSSSSVGCTFVNGKFDGEFSESKAMFFNGLKEHTLVKSMEDKYIDYLCVGSTDLLNGMSLIDFQDKYDDGFCLRTDVHKYIDIAMNSKCKVCMKENSSYKKYKSLPLRDFNLGKTSVEFNKHMIEHVLSYTELIKSSN
jgi:hypothetical protein